MFQETSGIGKSVKNRLSMYERQMSIAKVDEKGRSRFRRAWNSCRPRRF